MNQIIKASLKKINLGDCGAVPNAPDAFLHNTKKPSQHGAMVCGSLNGTTNAHEHLEGGSIYPEQAKRVEGLPFDFAQGKCASAYVKVHLWAHLRRMLRERLYATHAGKSSGRATWADHTVAVRMSERSGTGDLLQGLTVEELQLPQQRPFRHRVDI